MRIKKITIKKLMNYLLNNNFKKKNKKNNTINNVLLFKKQFKYLKTTHSYKIKPTFLKKFFMYLNNLLNLNFLLNSESISSFIFNNSEVFVLLLTMFSLGSLIGWRLIFSIIKRPSSFKQKLANYYIIFLTSILNHETIPQKYIFFSIGMGAFLGRKFTRVLSISYPTSILVPVVFIWLTFFFGLFLIYGSFAISKRYPRIFGRLLLSFLRKNASKEVLRIIGLKKISSEEESFIIKKKQNLKTDIFIIIE